MPRKRAHEDEDMRDDDEMEEDLDEEEDEDSDDDEDTIDLDQAEEEEEDDDDVDDDEDDDTREESVEDVERKRIFQAQAEEVLESLTLDDVKEVLKENDLDLSLAPKLKKYLVEVVNEGEMDSMDDAWEEAIERLEE
ncbi:MAG TPA: hypothetical protein VMV05_08385 [bacterium]|nr:hypothetical protein [bacterium]